MIRCLIVDDSRTARTTLRDILAKAKDVVVIDEASDGDEALEKALRLRPDVITMDVQMPKRDGYMAIRDIMQQVPTPIVVICSGGDDEALGISLKALQLGAVEVLEKPRATDPQAYLLQCNAIREAVEAMRGVKVVGRRGAAASKHVPSVRKDEGLACIGIAGSTGAPEMFRRILERVPADFPIPILIVQHIVDTFTEGFAKWLGASCRLPVRVAQDGEPVKAGAVLVAPGGRHMMVSMGKIRIDDGPPIGNIKPSANVLFASMAREYGAKTAGFVLTGMGDDGVSGLKLLRKVGGQTFAQGPNTSLVYGMPQVALETGAAAGSLEIQDIAEAVVVLGGREPMPALTVEVRPPGPSQVKAKRRRLLLVDDTETILRIEQAALAGSYDLVIARDGQEALEAIQRQVPDGVLMDIKMPRMTGDQALREIRKNPEWRSLPVVMCTSETDPDLLEGCTQTGCQAIVRKPIDVEQLRSVLRMFVPT